MKIIFNIFLFFVLITPVFSRENAVSHGEYGEFVRSINSTKSSYVVIADPTGKSTSQKIEKFELKNGTCSKIPEWDDCKNDRERIELKQKKSVITDSQTIRYEWKFYLDKQFPDVWPVKLSIAQFYDDKADRPIWMFQINQHGLQIENLTTGKSSLDTLLSAEELKGQWQHIELEVHWAKDKSGLFNVWVNKVQKLSYKGPTIKSGSYFFKYGLYRSFLKRWTKKQMIPDQVIYFSDLKMTKINREKG